MSLKELGYVDDLLDAGEVDSLGEHLGKTYENISKAIRKLDEIEHNLNDPDMSRKLISLAKSYLKG